MSSKDVRWFDLSRYGAALRVVPRNPLRGTALTCLEINDVERYESAVGFRGVERSEEAQAAFREEHQRTLERLGFGAPPQQTRVLTDNDVYERRVYFFSTKSEFTLSELKTLFNDLSTDDLRSMPTSAIAMNAGIGIDPVEAGEAAPEAWAAFARETLAKEAVGVWTPRENPFDAPWEQSPPLQHVGHAIRASHPGIGVTMVPTWVTVADHLARGNLRQNALVPFFATLEDALDAGLHAGELQKVDLPFALPLWVEPTGRVIALKDCRYAPELFGFPPEKAFRTGPEGIIVQALREMPQQDAIVREEVERWRAWQQAPETLTAQAFEASIHRMVEARCAFLERFPRCMGGVAPLTERAVGEQRHGAPKALSTLTESDTPHIVDLMRTMSVTVRQDPAIAEAVPQLLRRAHEEATEAARRKAAEKLREVAQVVQNAGDTPGTTVKHVDAGEKIGGARKDYARRAMAVEDIDSMNALEIKALVVKNNIFPPLDYRAMRESGMEPQVAMALKVLKDSLETAPSRDSYTDDPARAYVHAIGIARDRLATVHTRDDLFAAMKDLYERGAPEQDGARSRYITGGSSLQRQWGNEFSTLVYYGQEGYMPRKMAEAIDRNVDRCVRRDPDNPDAAWQKLIRSGKVKSDAEKEAERERSEAEAELHRPHLDHVVRRGEDWRGGRDVTADEIMAHFGFRAVEFGNWLPNNERQEVVNHAFDALADLAQALELPPQGIGLNGELAIAFGSRGTGGKRAALAHFEPSRMVMNLTRLRGAGSLGHEFFHALDWHLGGHTAFASEKGGSSAMRDLVFRMQFRPYEPAELLQKVTDQAKQGREYAASWLYQQPQHVRESGARVLSDAFSEAAVAFAATAAQLLEDVKQGPKTMGYKMLETSPFGAVGSGPVCDWQDRVVHALSKLVTERPAWTKVRDKVESNLRYGLGGLALQVTMNVANDMGVELPPRFFGGPTRAMPSIFVENAKLLDEKRSKPYWNTVCELFARAGAAYVHDRLEDLGVRSDYLVYGAGPGQYADHPIGNPNPGVVDRAALREHFERMLVEYRLQCVNRSEPGAELA